MDTTLRPGHPDDARACARIIRAWGAETPWMVPLDDLDPMAAFWADLFTSDHVWVADRAGEVTGFCTREPGSNNIGGLYVAPTARRHGLGKRLLDQAKEGCDTLLVWTYAKNIDAQRFYRREGLVEISREIEPETGLLNVEFHWVRPGTTPEPPNT